MGNNSRDANRHMLAHGRGISMAKNIFDSVRYNRKGNQVRLIKKIIEKAVIAEKIIHRPLVPFVVQLMHSTCKRAELIGLRIQHVPIKETPCTIIKQSFF